MLPRQPSIPLKSNQLSNGSFSLLYNEYKKFEFTSETNILKENKFFIKMKDVKHLEDGFKLTKKIIYAIVKDSPQLNQIAFEVMLFNFERKTFQLKYLKNMGISFYSSEFINFERLFVIVKYNRKWFLTIIKPKSATIYCISFQNLADSTDNLIVLAIVKQTIQSEFNFRFEKEYLIILNQELNSEIHKKQDYGLLIILIYQNFITDVYSIENMKNISFLMQDVFRYHSEIFLKIIKLLNLTPTTKKEAPLSTKQTILNEYKNLEWPEVFEFTFLGVDLKEDNLNTLKGTPFIKNPELVDENFITEEEMIIKENSLRTERTISYESHSFIDSDESDSSPNPLPSINSKLFRSLTRPTLKKQPTLLFKQPTFLKQPTFVPLEERKEALNTKLQSITKERSMDEQNLNVRRTLTFDSEKKRKTQIPNMGRKSIFNDAISPNTNQGNQLSNGQIAFTREELKQILDKYKVKAFSDYKTEKKREKEELGKMYEKYLESMVKSENMNKMLWYYYYYFPNEYPQIKKEILNKMNEEVFGNPNQIDLNKIMGNSEDETYRRRRQYSENKLPSIDRRPNFNVSMMERNGRKNKNTSKINF